MMPPEHGPQLAQLFPNSELVVIEGSGTLVPEDRPEELAGVLRGFLTRQGRPPEQAGRAAPKDAPER